MGKAASKISSETVEKLKKETYCKYFCNISLLVSCHECAVIQVVAVLLDYCLASISLPQAQTSI